MDGADRRRVLIFLLVAFGFTWWKTGPRSAR